MLNKILPKGTMRPLKKILGGLLLIMSAGFILNIEKIKDLVMNYSFISIGVLIASGYFLIKSGYQE